MAPRKNAREAVAASSTPSASAAAPSAPVVTKPKASSTGAVTWDRVLQNIYDYYMAETPQRTKLLDVFLAFLAVVGALQFLYCILAGNYVRPSSSSIHIHVSTAKASLHANPPAL